MAAAVVIAITLLSLSHSPPGRQGYASSAMQTSQHLGQITVLGLSSALFSVFLGAGSTELGYGAAFGLLLVPVVLAASLAGRARRA